MNWNTFTPAFKTYYGVYTEDFLVFGEFPKDGENPLENEELLLKICDDNDNTTVAEKNLFKMVDDSLVFKRDFNGEVKDLEIEHPVQEVALTPMIEQSWSEVLFYGLGNRRV
eukprot:CAMPEP_0170546468 /NCGR_PEP_ID=MMETSP0211-20121228/4834_1 /TAXON_ID=311385 /ORGANISM="Pseudokeronopsis sp., Strain OXSARD2" /LENGTH=111 /DNA_ID=CAMNT_0010850953 /DNA_START=172 /DNA_END=507 /DNA_ORIENTATION=+